MAINFPDNPSDGDTFSSGGITWTYIAAKGAWQPDAMVNSVVSDLAPSNPAPGDIWFDSTTAQLYIWYDDGSSTQWVNVTTASTNNQWVDDGGFLYYTDGQNVGIGTATPGGALTVETAGLDQDILTLSSDLGVTAGVRSMTFRSPAVDNITEPFSIQTGSSIKFTIDATDALLIDQLSNVLIYEGTVTSSVKEGIAKVYARYQSDNTEDKTLNITSLTDIGTGAYTLNLTNDMADALYSVTTSAKNTTSVVMISRDEATGSYGVRLLDGYAVSTTFVDSDHNSQVTGDLA